MYGFRIFATTVALISAILQTCGLILLGVSKFYDAEKTQRLYFMMLSFREAIITFHWVLLYNVPDLNFKLLQPIQLTGFLMMYESMIFMTLDRFFNIFLNIKYPLYWKYGHTVKLVSILTFTNILLCSIFQLTGVQKKILSYGFSLFLMSYS